MASTALPIVISSESFFLCMPCEPLYALGLLTHGRGASAPAGANSRGPVESGTLAGDYDLSPGADVLHDCWLLLNTRLRRVVVFAVRAAINWYVVEQRGAVAETNFRVSSCSAVVPRWARCCCRAFATPWIRRPRAWFIPRWFLGIAASRGSVAGASHGRALVTCRVLAVPRVASVGDPFARTVASRLGAHAPSLTHRSRSCGHISCAAVPGGRPLYMLTRATSNRSRQRGGERCAGPRGRLPTIRSRQRQAAPLRHALRSCLPARLLISSRPKTSGRCTPSAVRRPCHDILFRERSPSRGPSAGFLVPG